MLGSCRALLVPFLCLLQRGAGHQLSAGKHKQMDTAYSAGSCCGFGTARKCSSGVCCCQWYRAVGWDCLGHCAGKAWGFGSRSVDTQPVPGRDGEASAGLRSRSGLVLGCFGAVLGQAGHGVSAASPGPAASSHTSQRLLPQSRCWHRQSAGVFRCAQG